MSRAACRARFKVLSFSLLSPDLSAISMESSRWRSKLDNTCPALDTPPYIIFLAVLPLIDRSPGWDFFKILACVHDLAFEYIGRRMEPMK